MLSSLHSVALTILNIVWPCFLRTVQAQCSKTQVYERLGDGQADSQEEGLQVDNKGDQLPFLLTLLARDKSPTA